MPELPEVETVKRAIETAALSHQVAQVWQSGKKMRWPIPADIDAALRGGTITTARRRGKYIVLDIAAGGEASPKLGSPKLSSPKLRSHGHSMIIHLGMSGSVRIYPHDKAPERLTHDHLVITTSHASGGVKLVLNDPRRFGGIQLVPLGEDSAHPLLKGMGVEPLGNAMSGEMMKDAFHGKAAPIKTTLLDQKIIAGIGNIYASEALFLAGVSPKRKARNVSLAKCQDLAAAVRVVLEKAIAAGGTSLRDHVQPGGEIGYFVQQLNVYGRDGEPCPTCQQPIKMIRQTGRASFYCSACQR
ncbi:MAG: bifunctional DNA-formamidopyrimidine glycosylase/DNA-(apurinic or apyrimidinic site) lyase [Alphaproteobacteria bacterium]|nr:bifunctional DNA-formamidopyrimidine glycosylase/DNA-(apurinic or apyrimidinic site) lyase [Alphaproteobacteria bacterium]